MRLNVKALTYWKTEHSEGDNEDAFAFDAEHGLFAVSDGVGETSFSHQWAPVLAHHFINYPLLTAEPFEAEHWVRAAQKIARPIITSPDSLTGIAQTKARQGASATLLGVALI